MSPALPYGMLDTLHPGPTHETTAWLTHTRMLHACAHDRLITLCCPGAVQLIFTHQGRLCKAAKARKYDSPGLIAAAPLVDSCAVAALSAAAMMQVTLLVAGAGARCRRWVCNAGDRCTAKRMNGQLASWQEAPGVASTLPPGVDKRDQLLDEIRIPHATEVLGAT